MNYAPPQTLDSFVKTFGNVKDLQKGVFAYDEFNSTNNYMEVLNKTEPFTQINFHSTLRDSDISDKDSKTDLEDLKIKGFPNRWEYLKYYNINDVEIMISPIDNLIKMFFQWKVDMLANITLAGIVQCMKFKLLYDDWIRTHPFKRSNQPVITSFLVYNNNNYNKKKNKKIEKEKDNNNNVNNNNNSIEYENIIEDESSDEDEETNLFDFSSTFSRYFKERQQSQEEKEENEISINIQNLHIQPEVYLPPLSPEQLVEVTRTCFKITRSYMWSKTGSYFCRDKKANPDLKHIVNYKDKDKIQQKVLNQNNRCFIYNKEFNLINISSWDRIDCKLPHTHENIVLTCAPCNIERSNRSLELMQTIIQRKQYAVNNFFPLVLTNIHVEQMQEAIVGGLSNVWYRSNIAGETYISYLTYDYINKKT
jgi:hypothetical protein